MHRQAVKIEPSVKWGYEDYRYYFIIKGERIQFTACQSLAVLNRAMPDYQEIANAAKDEQRNRETADKRIGKALRI